LNPGQHIGGERRMAGVSSAARCGAVIFDFGADREFVHQNSANLCCAATVCHLKQLIVNNFSMLAFRLQRYCR
jgi:hypothetical protein